MKNVNFKPILFVLLCIIAAACPAAAGAAHAGSWQWISGPVLQDKIRQGGGLWIIDVRGAAAFEAVHIEGSVNIPANALAHKTFPAQKRLVLVDDSLGQRAAREAADIMAAKGQQRVAVLDGGVAAWRREGFPLVEREVPVRGVSADDLKWAIERSVEMDLYDLRPARERERSPLRDSEPVEGATIEERIERVKRALAASGTDGKDIAARIRRPRPAVLVFSASDDGEELVRKVLQGSRHDVRYLVGGYEAMVSERSAGLNAAGTCPTCPKKGQ